jgi:hypothetical protein
MSSDDFLLPRKANKKASTGPEFQFINITEQREFDDITKMTVRVHALREFNRRKREQTSSNGGRKGPVQPRRAGKHEPGSMQRFQVGASGLQPTRTQPHARFLGKSLRARYPHQEDLFALDFNVQSKNKRTSQSLPLIRDDCNLTHGPGCACFLLRNMVEVGAGELDPFGSLPVPQSRRIRLLVSNRE